MQNATTIFKLVYKRDYFNVFEMRPGARVVTTITDDGNVVFKEYQSGSRKVESSYRGKCSVSAFRLLCYRIEECIATADRHAGYCDDASEELKIYHPFGRVQTMDRGLGNEETCIGEIMHEFFEKDVELDK